MKELTLKQLATTVDAKLIGDPKIKISGVGDLESASDEDVSFLSNPRYSHLLKITEAAAVCIDERTPIIKGKNFLISKSPSETFQKILELFKDKHLQTGFRGIHPTAIIHEDATLADDITVGPYAVVDAHANIQSGSFVGPFVFVGASVQMGKACFLYAHSVVREHCILGNRVILQPGAVIGSCGFGYATSSQGIHSKLEQLGNVIVEDDVEIGANATIDRARFKTTRIGQGTKIDNLVQIAHNVEVGKHNIIAAQSGIAGSAKTGTSVMMGGQVGVLGHIEVTDFVMFATRSGVSKSIQKPGKYNGSPAVPLTEYNRTQVHLRKIKSYVKRIEALEKQLEALAGSVS